MISDFLILRSDLHSNVNLSDAMSFLENKHESSVHFKIRNIEIYCFGKHEDLDDFDNNVFFFGFLMYKGNYNLKAAKLLLSEKNPEWIKAKGNFFILSIEQEGCKIILDPLRKFHVFQVDTEFIFTSSFLSAAHLSMRLTLSLNAVYERLAQGFNIAPDTVYHEITRLLDPALNMEGLTIVDNTLDYSKHLTFTNINEALEHQERVIDDYFSDLKPFGENLGVDLGLSSGLDSRLLLAAIIKQQYDNVQLHSHSIDGVQMHDDDKKVAHEITKSLNLELKVIKCKRLEHQFGEELDALIKDNFSYFDGRNSYNMGAFAQNYTKSYKEKIMGDRMVSINGIGGEIFRNIYFTTPQNMRFDTFAENWLLYRNSKDFLGKPVFNRMISNFKRKLIDRLDVEIGAKVDLALIRRYYSEIRMPDGNAINNNANNKFYYFLTPFVEPEILISGYGTLPFHGNSIAFESSLIERMNPMLSQFPSHYAPNITNIDLRTRMRLSLIAHSPQKLIRLRFDIDKLIKLRNSNGNDLLSHLLSESDDMREIWTHFTHLFPNIRYPVLRLDYSCLANALMLASTLYVFGNKTDFSEAKHEE